MLAAPHPQTAHSEAPRVETQPNTTYMRIHSYIYKMFVPAAAVDAKLIINSGGAASVMVCLLDVFGLGFMCVCVGSRKMWCNWWRWVFMDLSRAIVVKNMLWCVACGCGLGCIHIFSNSIFCDIIAGECHFGVPASGRIITMLLHTSWLQATYKQYGTI